MNKYAMRMCVVVQPSSINELYQTVESFDFLEIARFRESVGITFFAFRKTLFPITK